MANMLAIAGPNSQYALGAPPAGLLVGFWHGVILPMTFLLSFVSPGVRIYEVHNNGRWYDFGFFLGAAGSLGGTGSTT
ncbi:MAG: hypothetical protein ACE10G_02630 [Gemmatimonadales bacterium]